MLTKEEVLSFRMPRWEELPDIGLYMDQVLGVVERNLALFSKIDDSKTLTPTMVNNYVKQKILEPPQNKKYNRQQLARLTIICIFKKFLNLGEIADGCRMLLEHYPNDRLYNIVCEEIETALHNAFTEPEIVVPRADDADRSDILIVTRGAMAFANIMYARAEIGAYHETRGAAAREREEAAQRSEKKKKD